MTVLKGETTLKNNCGIKKAAIGGAKHLKPVRSVRFSLKPSPEIVGDTYLQSTDRKRQYMRRGSRSPSMLAIDAVRSSAEIAQIEAYDYQQEKLEQKQLQLQSKPNVQVIPHKKLFSENEDYSEAEPPSSCQAHQSLTHHIRRSLPGKKRRCSKPLPKEIVDTELARSLFQKAHLTDAQKRRLSLKILSQVDL